MTPTTARDHMRETNRIFEQEVVANGNFDALDRVYTADARILPPGAEMVTGREAIKSFWKSAIAALGVESGKLETVEAETINDTIVEIGKAELVFPGGAKAAMKYVVIWKQEDGAWKWHVDIWNPNA
jgi:ketosteroid isomerase-like protein